jgi:peptidoglycan/LPS O-acetylase OafA/YrhL
VEEQFYIFFPLLALGLRKKLTALAGICVLIAVLGLLQVGFNVFHFPFNSTRLHLFNYTSLLTNMAPLCLGGFLAVLSRLNKIPAWIFFWQIELICYLLILYSLLFLPWKFQFLFLSLCNGYLVLKAWAGEFSFSFLEKITMHGWVIYIGKISYGIYVFHRLISAYGNDYFFNPLWSRIQFGEGWVEQWLSLNSWVIKFPVYSFLTIGLAHLSFVFIEKPILGLKDVYFGKKELEHPLTMS